MQRPGRFRWEYQKPYVQSIISDGNQVWFYDPDLEQVTIKPYSRALANTPAVLLSSEEPIEKNFSVSKPRDGKIELRPKTKDTGFVKATVGFSGLELQSMELEDSFGQKSQLQFSAIQRNHEVPEDTFSFTPPAGVDVITTEGKK
ncbi:outer membrane lipoprotein carrier protein [Gammaproteobacteria bacterium]